MSLLSVKDVSKAFGGVKAVNGCTLSVRAGTITGLIGPNGAGKSTLFDMIIGLLSPDAGEVAFDGTRIDGLLPHRIVRLGLAKTFQIPREFRSLTVLENLLVAAPPGAGERLWTLVLRPLEVQRRVGEITDRAEAVLETVGLRALRDEYARNLSGGQKKLLELARALMTSPKMVLLDEPVAGINPVLANKLVGLIGALRTQGTTFFLVEHDMDVVMRHCDHVIVLHQGRRLAEGTPEEVREDPRVIESYLGA
jgi:branched-chain amino acid transport system ATP-binding protein